MQVPPPQSSPEKPAPHVLKTIEELKKYASDQNLFSKMDLLTLQAVAAVISQHGFNHFEASKDTRFEKQARQGHRFVAINCEDLARKTLRLSGKPYEECEKMLHEIALQALQFKDQMKQKEGKA